MKAPVAEPAGREASPSRAACDTDAPIYRSVGHAGSPAPRTLHRRLQIQCGHGVQRSIREMRRFCKSGGKSGPCDDRR
jgi:hypothetical protein